MIQDLIDQISEAPVFRGCNKAMLAELLAEAPHRLRHIVAGDIIARIGDELRDMLILVEGNIYTSMSNSDDKELIVETLSGPLVLAPACVYSDENRFSLTVVAQDDCILLYIDRVAFANMMHRERQMMMNYINILSERYLKLNEKINMMTMHSLRERVLAYLKENQKIDNVAWLARVTGVARPSLSRVLSELKAEGIIERSMEGIVLCQNHQL